MKVNANERVIVALDVEEPRAYELIERLGEAAVFYKVGLSLFFEAGERVIGTLKEKGKKLFLDLKLHDIPYQVERAVRALNRYEPDILTVHASAGKEVIQAALAAANEKTRVVAVTVLTSIEDKTGNLKKQVLHLAEEAVAAGAHGVVCSGYEVKDFKELFPDKLAVVPGVRMIAGSKTQDQRRVVTPAQAVINGADYIVCGREITLSDRPEEAFKAIIGSVLTAEI
jgi:orotidine-5'-phosphate decarboxylase